MVSQASGSSECPIWALHFVESNPIPLMKEYEFGVSKSEATTKSPPIETNKKVKLSSTQSVDLVEVCERRKKKTSDLVESCTNIIDALGEDVDRDGLRQTPQRMAEALKFFTSGYERSPLDELRDAVFPVDTDDMVLVRNIDICSMCEHHLLPFFGKLHVGYVPRGRVLGLSKIVRIAEIFARRLQLQERLTLEIAQAIQDAVGACGVGVVIECSHMCMTMRGVEKVTSNTLTTSLLGCFRDDPQIRAEFLSLIRQSSAH